MRINISDRWRATPVKATPEPEPSLARNESNKFYEELVASKPALIDEKVRLHGRIIDEFNLALLDKISSEDLSRQVKRFVSEYVLNERIPLNQKELEAFTDEVL